MEFTAFGIENFRGIKKITLNLQRSPQANVFTLVGLNESGKTTILEALSRMVEDPLDFSNTDASRKFTSEEDHQSFIPVSERYNFSGEISFTAQFKIDASDRKKISDFLKDNHQLAVTEMGPSFSIKRIIAYKNSKVTKTSNTWNLTPTVKKIGGRKTFILNTLGKTPQNVIDAWRAMARFISETMLPHVLYFKSEVFDIPDKIYIHIGQKDKDQAFDSVLNKFYKEVIQDILFAIDESLDLTKHIVDRKKSASPSDKQNLAGTLQKMSRHVTSTVMNQWEKIFKRKLDGKKIGITCDSDDGGHIYLHFHLEDGGEIFDISDRSAGFRWFFAFIILTQYRGYRKHAALFLYDEPASSLHSSAQKQLIDCFARIPPHFRIVYSTHSHYLINPEWLDATYIVKNEAATPGASELDYDYTKTNIKLEPYRKFVSDNPSSVSYFQPILDLLQYAPSRLDSLRNAVLVEGKGDYYALTYCFSCANLQSDFDLIPCSGSGTADQLIALYSGWGRRFLVLLDSDNSGKKEQKRYIDKFGSLVKDRVISYSDINDIWTGFAIERVIGEVDALALQQRVFPDTEFSKKQFGLAIQELLITKNFCELSSDCFERLSALHAKLREIL